MNGRTVSQKPRPRGKKALPLLFVRSFFYLYILVCSGFFFGVFFCLNFLKIKKKKSGIDKSKAKGLILRKILRLMCVYACMFCCIRIYVRTDFVDFREFVV